jgi:hypothetical protein
VLPDQLSSHLSGCIASADKSLDIHTMRLTLLKRLCCKTDTESRSYGLGL